MAIKYLSGQGKVYIGEAGSKELRHLGNVSDFTVSVSEDTVEIYEPSNDVVIETASYPIKQEVSVQLTLDEASTKNMELGVFGGISSIASGTKTDSSLGTVSSNSLFDLGDFNISNLSIKDSSTIPKTLTLGTDYNLEDAIFGLVAFYDLSTYTMPLLATYDYSAREEVPLFTQAITNKRLVALLQNTAEANTYMKVELYNVKLTPVEDLPWITDELTVLTLKGKAQLDNSSVYDSTLGNFGKVIYL